MDDDFRERLAIVWDTTRVAVFTLILILSVIGWADITLRGLNWLFGN